jgi:hypothetical protein
MVGLVNEMMKQRRLFQLELTHQSQHSLEIVADTQHLVSA